MGGDGRSRGGAVAGLAVVLLGCVATVVVGQVCTETAFAAVVPQPKNATLAPFHYGCSKPQQGYTYDNSGFADGNGPRGAQNASDCCAICQGIDNCRYWSFNIDPDLPTTPGKCVWGALTYCCFLHASSTNLTKLGPGQPASSEYGAKGSWTSGAVVPIDGTSDVDVEMGGPTSTGQTELVLDPSRTTVVAADPSLIRLATVLSDQLAAISGVRFNTSAVSVPHGGPHITLDLSQRQPGPTNTGAAGPEAYTIKVDGNGVVVTCGGYTGCAWGISTLSQMLCVSGVVTQVVALPAVQISDFPDAPYRSVLMDTARSAVSVYDLYDVVTFAAYYKIRYVQLHLTDDHAWTFPSAAFPSLGTSNFGFRGPCPSVFSANALRGLVAFADARGVTIIPEIEGPGHSSAMRRSDPFFQGAGPDTPQGGGVLNVANDSFYTAMTTILNESASIFASSPYMHIGCDETGTPTSLPGYDGFAKEHGITGAEDLFAYYVKTMADTVSSLGKKAIVWGPASTGRLNAGDAIMMVWQGNSGPVEGAIKTGFEVINCPNTGGNMSAEWSRSLFDFGDAVSAPNGGATVPSNELIIGAQVNIWEVGWGYAQAPRDGKGSAWVEQAVARVSGRCGWWAGGTHTPSSAVNGTSFIAAYEASRQHLGRLQATCGQSAAAGFGRKLVRPSFHSP